MVYYRGSKERLLFFSSLIICQGRRPWHIKFNPVVCEGAQRNRRGALPFETVIVSVKFRIVLPPLYLLYLILETSLAGTTRDGRMPFKAVPLPA